jgi:hypothetical protein
MESNIITLQVTGRIMAETGEMNGRIKVAYTMDVVTKPAVGSPQQQAQRAGSPGEFLLFCEGNVCAVAPTVYACELYAHGVLYEFVMSVGQQFGLSGGMSMSGVLSTRGGGSPAGYPAAATSTRGSFGALGPQSQRVPTIVPANQVTL